jgi:glutamate dehydrogenase (NADP+)
LLKQFLFIEENKKVPKQNAFERMVESDRIITFRVAWIDDKGLK